MLSTLGFVALYAVGGTILAAVWTFLIGFAGIPGALLAHALVPDEDWRGKGSLLGLAVCVIGQAYVALCFCALLAGFTANLLTKRPDLIGWILWLVSFFLSILPASFAGKDAAKKARKKTQDIATTFTFGIAAVGFWVFVISPTVMKAGWDWMPYVG